MDVLDAVSRSNETWSPSPMPACDSIVATLFASLPSWA